MKAFIKYLVIVISTIVVGLYVIDKLYTYVYTKNISNNPRNKTQYVLGLKDKKIDYIFLGSSRVENHINTKLVEELTGKSALNLGSQGGRLSDVYIYLKLLQEQGVVVEKFFIQVDYVFNMHGPSILVGSDVLPFVNNKIVEEHIKENNEDYVFIKYVPFYKYATLDYKYGFREFFNSLINKKPRIDFSDGFDPRFDKYKQSDLSLPDIVVKTSPDFNKINTFCIQNNIEVVYFTAPFCSEANNLDYIKKLKTKIPMLKDYSRAFSNDSLYFIDCGHLNNIGANEFTKMLINDL
jgi:hypothetical protein